MKWDLSDLYSGIADPKIKKDQKFIQNLAKKFTKKYKNRLDSKNTIKNAIYDYEGLLERLYWLVYYASFLHSTDTKSTKVSNFYQQINEFSSQIEADLVWFRIELAKSDIKVKNYDYFLDKIRKKKKFMLSEAEETVLTKKNQTSSEAFTRLFDETDSQLKFKLNKRELSTTEIGKIMTRHHDRDLRKKATKVVSETYFKNKHFYTFTLNMLLLDKRGEDEMRGYKSPQHETYLSYDVDQQTVDAMTQIVTKNYKTSENFYKIKSKILKQKLYEWDRYSPIYKVNKKYSWDKAKNIVLNAFSEFDSEYCEIAEKFFDNNWIDAKITKNRQTGAYCSYLTPSKHPYIFMNFDGGVGDIMTLAHELGHAIHAYLSRDQTLVNFFPSTATAEIASIFAESLVFDYLYKTAKTKKGRVNLLTEKLQGSFAAVFRQTAFHLYETDIHNHRREKGELTSEDFSKYFQDRLQPMFGKGLKLTDHHKNLWMPILHFYHYNFYVFTYAFGELLTLSLYKLYKNNPSKFIKQYKKLLKQGGSRSPKDLLLEIGQDITNKDFWQNGLNLLDNYVEEFKQVS